MSDVPRFVLDVLDADTALEPAALDALNRLPCLLEPVTPSGRARLLGAVESVFRYAPFYARLAMFWDLPERSVEELCGRANGGAFRKSRLPGLSLIDVEAGPKLAGASARLLRFDPGARFPAHRHLGDESVLVLEGSYRDGSGKVFRAGDLQTMTAGSEHALEIAPAEPCVAAVVESGIEFRGVALRWLSRWFDKS
jgi:putative transcriptional regulator